MAGFVIPPHIDETIASLRPRPRKQRHLRFGQDHGDEVTDDEDDDAGDAAVDWVNGFINEVEDDPLVDDRLVDQGALHDDYVRLFFTANTR